jgi:hypothetical protein
MIEREILRGAAAIAAAFAAAAALPAAAQQVEHGVTVQRGWLNARKAIEPLKIQNSSGNQIKGMQRVAITVFNVAFPDDFELKAKSHGVSGMFASSASSRIHTHLDGIDQATRQAITDHAYADFVAQLKSAGFEVIDQQQLAAAAPEITRWKSLPNGSRGRFGTYLAPAGMALHFMPGDTDNRSTSGMFGQQMTAFRSLDRTEAYQRTPYVARDANATAVAVTLVVDYGVYSTSGNRRGFGKKVSTGFEEGATVAAGTVGDDATVVRVWNAHSGGFPTQLTLQQPVISDADIGPADSSPGDFVVRSSPALFTPPAIDVIERANGAIVGAFVEGR